MMIGIAASMSVPLADSYFLGQLGTTPLAAISFTFPVALSLMSLSIGLGAGTSSVVSRAIGDGDDSRARMVGTHALALCIILITFVTIIGYWSASALFSLMGASGETLAMVLDYMLVWYVSLPLLAIMMVGSNLLRSNGDAQTASIIMITVAVINVAIDPLLIFGAGVIPAYGIKGAAYASLLARSIAAVWMLWVIAIRYRLLSFHFAGYGRLLRSWLQIGSIAVPAALGNAVNPIGITLVTGLIAGYGEPVVAGFGVATRIETFVAIPMLAMSAAIGPVAGQNYGARKYSRVVAAHSLSYMFCVGWSLLMAAALWLAAEPLAAVFSDGDQVRDTITSYLNIVTISLAGYGITVVAAGGLNAIGRPLLGLSIYLIRTAGLYVPVAWLLSRNQDATTVFVGMSASNIVSGIAVAALSLYLLRSRCQGALERA